MIFFLFLYEDLLDGWMGTSDWNMLRYSNVIYIVGSFQCILFNIPAHQEWQLYISVVSVFLIKWQCEFGLYHIVQRKLVLLPEL